MSNLSYDVLLKGGRVIDPAQAIDGVADVAISNGRIAAAGTLDSALAREVIDVHGQIVTPGLIDLHTHVYPGVSPFGIDPDETCLARGVTTVVDTGSSGAMTFPGFRRYVIEKVQTRILAYLHIASIGCTLRPVEIHDLEYVDVDACVETIEANRDVILGVKLRLWPHVVDDLGLEPLRRARQAADRSGTPLMLHGAGSLSTFAELCSMLQRGDVITHCFGSFAVPVVDEHGRTRPEIRAALERGVLLDVGHGKGSFDFKVAEAAVADGLLPYTISTDLHVFSRPHPVPDLCNVLSKFLMLGLSLPEVIRRATANPATVIGRPDLGTLAPGAIADVAVFDLIGGTFTFVDSHDATRTGRELLEPRLVIKDGRVVTSAREATLAG